MKTELITYVVEMVLSTFNQICYDNDDNRFDNRLSEVLYTYVDTENTDKDLVKYKQEVEKLVSEFSSQYDENGKQNILNCWQMVSLINFYMDPLLICQFKPEELVNHASMLTENDFAESGHFGLLESKSQETYTPILNLDNIHLENIPFGASVYIFGTAHLGFYTQEGKVLSHWSTHANNSINISGKCCKSYTIKIDIIIIATGIDEYSRPKHIYSS